ncbi:TrbI/VirB10 family protein [Asticcacaulis sp. DXS10W]|uniref:TrbI/VirB10 family protein n=1 Tax=Asticcacaulis currens TaxID=2984210 RepID=A0ABT5IBC0_9CAUL|nr:TrbI/VirB10 family protein [Asticcacaulis currens]MDC7693474.1 TrbI/VirB10 family protein [Asticcacaulis currens]
MTDTAPRPKVDPETLVLRAQPRRIIRFKRHVLVASAAVACVSLFGVTWLALGASAPRVLAQPETFNPDRVADTQKAQPDKLSQLPQTYDQIPEGVPHLGPPLPAYPGDPSLRETQVPAQEWRSGNAGGGGVSAPATVSEVFFQIAPRLSTVAEKAPPSDIRPLDVVMSPVPVGPTEGVSLAKPDFVDRKGYGGIYNGHQMQTPVSPYQVMAGTVISASLVTGLKSDLPGFVIAQVSQPVFDSVSAQHLLIPAGTRLLGQYDDQVAFGQSRALVVWKRLILPDGSSLEIDNLPATDTEGYAGLSDKVDYHTWSLLKGVGLSTLLGLASHSGQSDDDSDLVRAFRDATRDTANQAGQRIVDKALNIRPSITVRPGWPVRVIVHKDLILKPYAGGAGHG